MYITEQMTIIRTLELLLRISS